MAVVETPSAATQVGAIGEVQDGSRYREMVLEVLHDLPDAGLFEAWTLRFLKSQWSSMSADERFDRAWMAARRVGAESGITGQDVRAETEKLRRTRQ